MVRICISLSNSNELFRVVWAPEIASWSSLNDNPCKGSGIFEVLYLAFV